MDACRACGARLAQGIAWCGQCYTPVTGSAAPGTPGTPAGPFTTRPFARRPGVARPGPPRPAPAPEYSRWKAGATSMGWVGRALTTLGILVAAAFLYVYAFPVMVGIEDVRTRMLFLAFASPAVVYGLSRVWRPSRIR